MKLPTFTAWFVLLLSVTALSCATALPDDYYDNETCDPYGECRPGMCGNVDAGCGITLDCGPCEKPKCPEGKIRSCGCQGMAPDPNRLCPCITPAEQKACAQKPPA
jgi:hypothetical protein